MLFGFLVLVAGTAAITGWLIGAGLLYLVRVRRNVKPWEPRS